MKKLRIETKPAEARRDASKLERFLGRVIECNWETYNPLATARPTVRPTFLTNKAQRNLAVYESEQVLRKYGYRIGIVITGNFVEYPDGTTGDDELVSLAGQVEPSSIPTNRLALSTPEGTLQVTFAHMPKREGRHYQPSVRRNGRLELPTSFDTTLEERFEHFGLYDDILPLLNT